MIIDILKSQVANLITHIQFINDPYNNNPHHLKGVELSYLKIIELSESLPYIRENLYSHEDFNAIVDGSKYGYDSLENNLKNILDTSEIISRKTKTYAKPKFDDIKTEIIQQINSSVLFVWIAVAWFTDNDIFDALIRAKNRGVNVQVLTLDSDGNKNKNKDNILDFRGKIEAYYFSEYKYAKTNLHHKFCVIDICNVITGSYNWTKSAENNLEDVMFISDEVTAKEYALRFIELKKEAIEKKDSMSS